MPDRVPSRRTMREYIEAMAGMFLRNGCRTFVLSELRDGVLWTLRKRLGLSPKLEKAEDLIRIIGRREPRTAEKLAGAVADVGQVLGGKKPATEMNVVNAARNIGQCL